MFLDPRAPKAVREAMWALGFDTIELPPYAKLQSPVACHPDLLLHDLGGKLLVYRDYYEANRELFADLPMVPTDYVAGQAYPRDIGMDALVLGDKVLCLPEYTCPEMMEQRRVVPVRQGYAACAALKVSDNAIVTADPAIATAAESCGVTVLKIRPGHIVLDGYDYGFIGGTAFMVEDALYFAGDLFLHPDGKAIADFCAEQGVTCHSLVKNMMLYDLGFLKYNKKSM